MPSRQRYCCVCKNFGGKVVDGKKVSMHRFPADLRVRKVWIQRCRNARPNFVFVNSDQTRLCAVHFIGRCGPTKGNPLPCFFPRADGGEKVYKLTALENVSDVQSMTNDDENTDSHASEMELTTDNRSPDLSFENDANGLLVDCNESLLDVSLRLHDYGQFRPVPSIIRHQCQQVQPEMVSVSTQTEESRIPKTTSTQTDTVETASVGCQARRPTFTFDDIRDDNSKVLFYTGIPNAGTFQCIFDEMKFTTCRSPIFSHLIGP